MQVLKTILIIVDIILALAVVVLVMLQRKDDQGVSGAITGAAANNFLDKNKGRTRSGMLKRMTIIFAVALAIVTVALNIVYPLA
jgi:preprotein translocase subunit SecG